MTLTASCLTTHLKPLIGFLQRFDQKCQLLAKFPEMGRIWEELNPPLRSFPIDKYLIFYRPIPSGIEVIRVLSDYRDLEAVFREGAPEQAIALNLESTFL